MRRWLPALWVAALAACATVPPTEPTWPAELRASERWELAFDVAGVLLEPPVASGESIGQGQVVARLSPDPFDERLELAQQAMAAAQARWLRVTESIDPAQLRVYSPSITTTLDLGPMRVAVLEAEIGVGTAATELRHARWARAAADLASPRPGRVTRWLVPSGGSVRAGQPVVQLEDDTTAEVVARIPYPAVVGLRRGRRAEVLQGPRSYQAVVREVAPWLLGDTETQVILGIVERARPRADESVVVRLLVR